MEIRNLNHLIFEYLVLENCLSLYFHDDFSIFGRLFHAEFHPLLPVAINRGISCFALFPSSQRPGGGSINQVLKANLSLIL